VPLDSEVRSLLLVRNGVDHDARVLRAARVAQRTLGGSTLVVGVATAASPAGPATVEGVAVVRLPARPPGLGRVAAPGLRRPGLVARRLRGRVRGRTSRVGTPPFASEPGDRRNRPTPPAVANPQPSEDRLLREDCLLRGSTATTRLTLAARTRRILSGLSFSLQALALARRARPELVHANDWNTAWTGLLIKCLCRSRVVYDSHELWADRNGRWEWRPWLLACEALFVRAADEVLTSSPGYADVLAARYRIARPTVVRNIPEGPATAQDSRVVPQSRPVDPLVVYVGGLMPGRGLEQMIDALPLIPEARLRAVGPGALHYRASLLARAQATGVLDRVELRQPVAPAEVGGALAEAAAGLCLIQPICRSYELSLPNKLFEYAAAGVPVLASDLPVIGALVRQEGIGVLAPPEDPRAIAASLERLLEPDVWRLAAERTRAFAETHSWDREAGTLAGVYRRAEAGTVARRGPTPTDTTSPQPPPPATARSASSGW
jgi:glycosyltransferase involved in cell wall biosynthesis